MNPLQGLCIAPRVLLLAPALALLISGCVVAPARAPVVVHPAPAEFIVSTPAAPPAPLVEVIPVAPYAGAVWTVGYWNWVGTRHVWVPGRYIAPRPGYRWEPHRWAPGPGGHWHLRGGIWIR